MFLMVHFPRQPKRQKRTTRSSKQSSPTSLLWKYGIFPFTTISVLLDAIKWGQRYKINFSFQNSYKTSPKLQKYWITRRLLWQFTRFAVSPSLFPPWVFMFQMAERRLSTRMSQCCGRGREAFLGLKCIEQ